MAIIALAFFGCNLLLEADKIEGNKIEKDKINTLNNEEKIDDILKNCQELKDNKNFDIIKTKIAHFTPVQSEKLLDCIVQYPLDLPMFEVFKLVKDKDHATNTLFSKALNRGRLHAVIAASHNYFSDAMVIPPQIKWLQK